MPKNNSQPQRALRRQRAEERAAETATYTAQEKLDLLDAQGYRAVKERAQLQHMLDAAPKK